MFKLMPTNIRSICFVLLLTPVLFACNSEQFSVERSYDETSVDSDGDGLDDQHDQWPNDPEKPKISSLWGFYGENWDVDPGTDGIQSRLPFYGLAGYRDGIDPPAPECTLDVTSFGAIADDDNDDTDAFWDTLIDARKIATSDNLVAICIPPGTFNLSKQLHLNRSGMILRGAGREATVLKYTQGMIAQTYPEFIGNVTSNWAGNMAIVLGDNGLDWTTTMTGNIHLNELPDLNLLPKQGDLQITLSKPLTADQLSKLESGNYRVRLMESTHYSNRDAELKSPIFTAGIFGGSEAKERVASRISNGTFQPQYNEFTPMKFLSSNNVFVPGNYDEYKYGHGEETAYQQFIVSYEPGTTTMQLDRPVRFDMTYEHDAKRPKVQFIDDATDMDTDIGIENLTIEFPATTWRDCTDALAGYACDTSSAGHAGYWAQGGVNILSDFSWVRNISFLNAGNPLKISGDFNTAVHLIIDSNRPTNQGNSKTESLTDPNDWKKLSVVGHVGIATHGTDNLVDDVIYKANFIHSLSMSASQGTVYSNIRAVQPKNNPVDSNGDEYVKINLDHHRQIIHSTLWTNIQVGGSHRMWESTGSITEGFNVAANNTYWGINSTSPEVDYWPHNRKGSIEWGYHYINMVGTNIQQKPAAPQYATIDDFPYPYANSNPEMNPFPYHPDNAHLEAINPDELWPQNLYHAQREAFFDCKLTNKPAACT